MRPGPGRPPRHGESENRAAEIRGNKKGRKQQQKTNSCNSFYCFLLFPIVLQFLPFLEFLYVFIFFFMFSIDFHVFLICTCFFINAFLHFYMSYIVFVTICFKFLLSFHFSQLFTVL